MPSKEPDSDNEESVESGSLSGVVRSRAGEKRVLIAESGCLAEESEPEIVTLPHPSNGQAAKFLITKDNKSVKELLTYGEENRSWFIDETIESNGRVFLAAPFDPALILMPILKRAEKLQPLDQILAESKQKFPELSRLREVDLSKIADVKGSADLNVWKFDEGKALKYLTDKVERLCEALIESKVNPIGGATSGNFIRSLNDKIDRKEYLEFAFGIAAEYLDAEFANLLRKTLKLESSKDDGSKKRNPTPASSNSKRAKRSEGPDEDYSKSYTKPEPAKNAPKNAKQRALVKSASGTKNITSFFSKKQ